MSSEYKGFASGKACGGDDQCVIHAEPVSLGDEDSPIVRATCQRFGRADQSNQLSAERELRGLTTAASLWVSAGVGIAAGLGREATAILSVAVAPMQTRAAPCLHSHGESVGVSGRSNLGELPSFVRKYGGLRADCVRRCAKPPARGHAPRTLVETIQCRSSISLVNHDSTATYAALAYCPVESC
jgi:MgtC family